MRFLSCEPLLGPLELALTDIHWVITGGESGPKHRPIKEEWVRSIRDQCRKEDIAFFHKQWGGVRPKSNGRELDGRTWGEMPVVLVEHSHQSLDYRLSFSKWLAILIAVGAPLGLAAAKQRM